MPKKMIDRSPIYRAYHKVDPKYRSIAHAFAWVTALLQAVLPYVQVFLE